MNNMQPGEGVQVVKIVEARDSHAYQLNEKALENILMQEDIRECPVVVVSVAGAYRGGKSFLLDFFLRYLHSEEQSRRCGQWLGAADDPLKGFSWRGGSERNTTGIVLWSQPMRATLPSGETVVVLLMDTQGTFDSQSTVRDCSTIFALSTLISSVQIYNISQNIKEDDLQHLQLFTEYGKLAADSGDRPFQVLKFLVRDWTFPYEHSFGADGGKELLQKRLETKPEQPEELREIRQHIHSCFESVSCFLMPHPGFAVSDPKFNGRLADIRQEFKDSLLELVPSIFERQNLKPKMINGQRVKARDLLYYFRAYMAMFNSNTLPTPRTILKATAEAALLSAGEQVRRQYRERMQCACAADRPALAPAALRRLHADTLAQARELFTTFKNMASQQDIDIHWTRISQELESQLPQYELTNKSKIQSSLNNAKAAYEQAVQKVSGSEQLCLHPRDLQQVHEQANEAAMRVFDSARTPPEAGEDEDRNNLCKELRLLYEQLLVLNERNNNAAVSDARSDYCLRMERACGGQPCMSERELQSQHEAALASALNTFHNKRNRRTQHTPDNFVAQLERDIQERYGKLLVVNENNNKSVVQMALTTYNNYMMSICSPHLPCLHPEDLLHEHRTARDRAMSEFHSRRTGEDAEEDGNQILTDLEARYKEICCVNEANNELAVTEAFNAYLKKMKDLVETPFFLKLLLIVLTPILHAMAVNKLNSQYEAATDIAIRVFREKRRPGPCHSDDPYLEKLNKMMSEYYDDTHSKLLF